MLPLPRVPVRRRDGERAGRVARLEEADRRVELGHVLRRAVEEVLVVVPVLLLARIGAGRLVVQRLGHVGDAVVVDVAVDGPREALAGRRRRVAEEDRLREALATDVRVGRHDGGVAQCGVERRLRIGERRAHQIRGRERDVRAGAVHQVRVARRGPASDPAAVLVLLDEAVDQLAGLGRVQQRIRGPDGPVGVPEPVVDVELARQRRGAGGRRGAGARRGRRRGLVGVHVDRRVGRARVLERRIGIQVEAVEVRVQRRRLVGRAVDGDHAEPGVPCLLGDGLDVVEALAGQLEHEVVLGLRDADERRRDLHRHDLVGGRVEIEVARDVGAAGAARRGRRAAARRRLVERRVDEHPLRAVREAARDVRVAGHDRLTVAGGRCECRAVVVVDVVEDQRRRAAGEGEAELGGVVGRRDLGLEPVLERDAVVVRPGDLVVMAERERARRAADRRRARGRWHHLERLAVAHPRARLVADGERLQHRQVARVVALLVAVQPVGRARVGLRDPEVEAVRDRGGGDVVAAREGAVGVRAAARVDPVREVRAVRRGGVPRHREVVDPALEGLPALAGRVVVVDQDALDRLAGRDGADVRRDRVPLLHVERLGVALAACRERVAVLVDGVQVAQVGAVVELQVDGRVGALARRVAAAELGEDRVRELRAGRDRDVDVVDAVVGVVAPVGDQAG